MPIAIGLKCIMTCDQGHHWHVNFPQQAFPGTLYEYYLIAPIWHIANIETIELSCVKLNMPTSSE